MYKNKKIKIILNQVWKYNNLKIMINGKHIINNQFNKIKILN